MQSDYLKDKTRSKELAYKIFMYWKKRGKIFNVWVEREMIGDKVLFCVRSDINLYDKWK